MRLDAHQHFWQYDARELPWITDDMPGLKRDFLPDDLRPHLEAAGMDGTILVQARQNMKETDWILHLAEDHDEVLGVVAWFDLQGAELEDLLERFAYHKELKGMRHAVNREADDRWLLQRKVLAGLELLQSFRLTFDLVIRPSQLPAAIEVAGKLPDNLFVLDHLAKPDMVGNTTPDWEAQVRALAEAPNVYAKLSGFADRVDTLDQARPYLDVMFDAFGAERIMFGSDWPVCTRTHAYADVLGLVEAYLEPLDAEAQASVLGGAASNFYGVVDEHAIHL